ncbi:MAG: RdgB/HAM1 family non-canonical purine NTP pyrophosphatase, partial [Thermoprotei archaeon]
MNSFRPRILFVTGNRNKFAEASLVAEGYGVDLVQETRVEKLEIQAENTEQVASYAAKHAYAALNSPLVVEDTGLHVRCLNGFPGVYASYVFQTIGLTGLLKVMGDCEDRSAVFDCCVVYQDSHRTKLFHGVLEGRILKEPAGSFGFGYDPIFAPDSHPNVSLASLSTQEKNSLSHRAKAFSKLFDWLSRANEPAGQ